MKRSGGVRITKPIVFGSIAQNMGKKQNPNEHSHKWTIYLRAEDGSDLSNIVAKVLFTLHPSCSIPKVTCLSPPYTVSQTGWGEFEAQITIFFLDDLEKPVSGSHFLRLFHEKGSNLSATTPVVSETYDELIFKNPPEKLVPLLLEKTAEDKTMEQYKKYYKKFSHTETLEKLKVAQDYITEELNKALEELRLLQLNKAN
eukprot:augustus_masked-scaffold_5-processed-gene-16.19-mRNA-1 protein AED:0.43 eAED:0.49 QI:0/-1/0/1/-1/1/1/0/199